MSETTQRSKAIQEFLDVYEREHATTMRVLRAFPADRTDLRPHPRCKTARELAFVFAIESGLGQAVLQDRMMEMLQGGGGFPAPPESWAAVLDAVEQGHRGFAELVRSYDDEQFHAPVHFMTGPQQIGTMSRRDAAWFLLHDQIHHRGQMSIYLRMADAKVPSIYGPSADEPWS